jgi:tRNA threonylcarbamoyladenosine biosynthesis protein TsaB
LASSDLLLAIDNSTDFLNLSLAEGGGLIEERHGRPARPSSEVLPLKVAALLEDHGFRLSDLSALAVSLGPGSFTGIRVALSYTKGVSAALRLPLIGIPTLDLLAFPFIDVASAYICPVVDAKKGEVFFAQYHHTAGALSPTSGYHAAKPHELADKLLRPCIVFGSGVEICESILSELSDVTLIRDSHQRVTGESLVRLALEKQRLGKIDPIRPIYGRKSEAEIRFQVTVT